MLSSTTYVKTPATGLAITLADAKLHLRVDDVEQGAQAQVTVGDSDAALKLVAKLTGARGNDYSIELLEAGNDTPLTVAFNADKITVNLATDSFGSATSTANDIIAALFAVPAIQQRFNISSDEGAGTGVMAPQAEVSFEGGVDGTSSDDSLITNLIYAAQGQAETILRRSLLTQTLVHRTDYFPGCRQFVLERGPVKSLVVNFLDENGASQVLDDAQYIKHFESVPEYIELASGASWPRTFSNGTRSVSIEMQCGYGTEADIPPEIQQAIRMMVGYWYSVREDVLVGAGYTPLVVPHGAEWLLWPYRDFRF